MFYTVWCEVGTPHVTAFWRLCRRLDVEPNCVNDDLNQLQYHVWRPAGLEQALFVAGLQSIGATFEEGKQ